MPVYIYIHVSFLAFNLSGTSVIHRYFPILHLLSPKPLLWYRPWSCPRFLMVPDDTAGGNVILHWNQVWSTLNYAPSTLRYLVISVSLGSHCRDVSPPLCWGSDWPAVQVRDESLSWHITFVLVFLNSPSFLEQGDDCMLLQHYKCKVKCLKAIKEKC